MIMSKLVTYLRLRNRHYVKVNEDITLGQVAQIIAPDQYEGLLKGFIIYHVRKEDKHLIVIDIMQIIKKLKEVYPDLDVRNIGKAEIIVEILSKDTNKRTNLIAIIFVWILLFIGSGLAIMNFHQDVEMLKVHKRIYYLVTGEEVEKPLILQIPYSIGIGVGMILFFNHIFKKKINEEPSPLEVEMFLYQENLDQYVALNENIENRKKK